MAPKDLDQHRHNKVTRSVDPSDRVMVCASGDAIQSTHDHRRNPYWHVVAAKKVEITERATRITDHSPEVGKYSKIKKFLISRYTVFAKSSEQTSCCRSTPLGSYLSQLMDVITTRRYYRYKSFHAFGP